MEFAFTGISFYRSAKKSSLAKVHRTNGDVKINLEQWNKLPEAHKVYVLCHEEGHYVLGTKDELEADRYASKKYLDAGYPISKSVKALAKYLNENNPVHYARVWAQYQRALQYDFTSNGNQQAARSHYQGVPEIKKELMLFIDPSTRRLYLPDSPDVIAADGWDGDDYYNFLGIGKGKAARQAAKTQRKENRQVRKTNRIANRQQKRATRNDNKQSKIRARNIKADSRLELAKQGVDQNTFGDKVLDTYQSAMSGLQGVAGGLMQATGVDGMMPATNGDLINQQRYAAPGQTGYEYQAPAYDYTQQNGQQYNQQDPMVYNPVTGAYETPPPPEEKNNTGLIIGIVAGSLLLGVAIYFITKNK